MSEEKEVNKDFSFGEDIEMEDENDESITEFGIAG